LTKTVGFHTGVNFSTVYYEHKHMSYESLYDKRYYPLSSSYYPGLSSSMIPYAANNNMDFSIVRIPFLFTVTVPGTIQLDLRAGFFFSFLRDYNLGRDNYYYYYYYYPEEKPANKDFGYIFSSGLSYPLSDKFKASLNAAYITGRKPFLDNLSYKHGSSEFTLGIEYTGFLKNRQRERAPVSADSLSRRVIVTLTGGLDYSWNGAEEPNGEYYGCFGPSLGFSLKFPLGQKSYFQTGFTFERKGYSIRDSSSTFFRLSTSQSMYDVDTKIQTDYAIIPALLTFFPGNRDLFFFSTGPWLGLKLNARTVGVAYNEDKTGTIYQLRETIVNDDLEGSISDYDLGWLFGCGVKIPVANYAVDLSLQYSHGFREMFSGSQDLPVSDGPELMIKNSTVSIVMGFRIPL
jgi:hypothetical protein